MKIIEALKELPLIEKKIDSNAELLQKYSSDIVIGENFIFGSEEAQRKQVSALVQSTRDLVKTRAALKRRLQVTNTQVMVTVDEITMSIVEWMEYKTWGINKINMAYKMLNESNSLRPHNLTKDDTENGFKRLRFYDEIEKNVAVNFYQELLTKISARLEIVNATTDLVE